MKPYKTYWGIFCIFLISLTILFAPEKILAKEAQISIPFVFYFLKALI